MKAKVYSIVFMQSEDDLTQMASDLGVESWGDLDDNQIIEYLSQWDNGIEHCDSNLYDAEKIDSELLGYRVDRRKTKSGYLFSRNYRMNYCGLSYFERIAS